MGEPETMDKTEEEYVCEHCGKPVRVRRKDEP